MVRAHNCITTSILIGIAVPLVAPAQFNNIFIFPASSSQPMGAPVLLGNDLYGVSHSGGAAGTFFQLNRPVKHGDPWTETVLYQFTGGARGGSPGASPIYFNGIFYGATLAGGAGFGTVYALVPDGAGGYSYSVIYTFAGGADGVHPTFLVAWNGNLYGISGSGGAFGGGTVFQLTGSGTTWTETVIHSFNLPVDGAGPQYIVPFNGLLYVSTAQGGAGSGGTVVQLTPPASGSTWTTNIIYAFGTAGDAGFHPEGFTFGPADGNLYGVQQVGGGGLCTILGYAGCGGVYKLTNQNRPITWKFTQIYTFKGGSDGDAPVAPPAFDPAGNMLVSSTGLAGTPGGSGAILKLTHNGGTWTPSVLHTFTGADGDDPAGALTLNAANGNYYGFTVHGGVGNNGTAYIVTTAAVNIPLF